MRACAAGTEYGDTPMKRHLAFACAFVLGACTAAAAQTKTEAPDAARAPAATPAAGRAVDPLPPPNPFPVGGTDNVSDGDYVIGPDYVISEELRTPHAAWAT